MTVAGAGETGAARRGSAGSPGAVSRRVLLAAGGATALTGAAAIGFGVQRGDAMAAYAAAVAVMRAALVERPDVVDLLRYATLAPNSHNTQPWRFRVGADKIEIAPDDSRKLAIVDPDDHHLFVSLGCAAANLSMAAGATGRPGVLGFEDAARAVRFTYGDAPPTDPTLYRAITARQSSRTDYDGRPIGAAALRLLARSGAASGVEVILITDPRGIGRIRDLVVAGNTVQMSDPAFVRELKRWIRFSPGRALATGDGLFSAASGSPVVPDWLGLGLFDIAFRVGSENDKYARQLKSSAGVAIFVSRGESPRDWVDAGRACQSFALQATALGIKHAFVNQPVEVAGLRGDLASLVGLPQRRPDLVMRFGYGPTLPFSARRPVRAVLTADLKPDRLGG